MGCETTKDDFARVLDLASNASLRLGSKDQQDGDLEYLIRLAKEELPTRGGEWGSRLTEILLDCLGYNDELDRAICQGVLSRLGARLDFPFFALFREFVFIMAYRSLGMPWEDILKPKVGESMAFALAQEEIRRGAKTSNLGEPGEAFIRVAKRLGISPAAAMARYYRARRKLSKYIDMEEHDRFVFRFFVFVEHATRAINASLARGLNSRDWGMLYGPPHPIEWSD